MATAVEPSSAPSAPGKPPLSLPIASLIGTIYVLAALAVVFYAVPLLWSNYVGSTDTSNNLLIARAAVQVVAFVGLLWFGGKLAGEAPPKGIRGGIFLMLIAAVVIFFVTRMFALNIEGGAGKIVSAVVAVGLIYLCVRFFTGHTGEEWMVALEEQGWFSVAQYKRSLGVRARRFTILGIILIGVTGAYTLRPETGILPERWTLSMPFDIEPITLIPDARYIIPAVIVLATLWIAFRVVNVPTFAEFLIATEAEMNKVSWSTRKRLAQDTVVVLLTTLIMTLFLLVVDLFWGWLLSRNTVGVLPSRATNPEKGKVQELKW